MAYSSYNFVPAFFGVFVCWVQIRKKLIAMILQNDSSRILDIFSLSQFHLNYWLISNENIFFSEFVIHCNKILWYLCLKIEFKITRFDVCADIMVFEGGVVYLITVRFYINFYGFIGGLKKSNWDDQLLWVINEAYLKLIYFLIIEIIAWINRSSISLFFNK